MSSLFRTMSNRLGFIGRREAFFRQKPPRFLSQANAETSKADASGMSMTKVVAALSGVGIGMAAIEQFNKTTALPSLVDIDAINASFSLMSSNVVVGTTDELANTKIIDFSNAVNESIHKGNLEAFKRHFSDLSLLAGGVSDEYLMRLVHHLAETGKVSFLKYLNDALEIEITDPLGKKLIAHPAGDTIEKLVGQQFALGPGKIKRDGARAYIAKRKEDDIYSAAEIVEDHLCLSGLDVDADLLLTKKNLNAKQSITKNISDKYDNVVVLDWENEKELHAYGDALKIAADKKIGKTSSLFVLGAGHYSYGVIDISNDGGDQYHINTLYMESLGASEGANPADGFMDSLMHAFPKTAKAEHYCPELKIQYSPVGCSIMVLNDFDKMMHYDWTVQMHQPQYHDVLPSKDAIWAYMKRQNPTPRLGTYEVASELEGDYTEVTYQYLQVEKMPLLFSRQKQSMTKSGLESVWDIETGRKDPDYQGGKRVVFGMMGYELGYQQSPAERQLEASQGYTPFSNETVVEYMDRHLKPNAQGKIQNKVIEEIYTWTLPLLHWLVDKSEEEINALMTQHSLESFKGSKGISDIVESTSVDYSPIKR